MGKRTHNIFFTSDWHIGHKNVLEYDGRPFKDIHEMADSLVKKYNATVGEGDVCYFLGDFSFAKADYAKAIVKQLNGTKVFILGNHDKSHDAMKKLGFDVVMNGATMYIQNELVTMSHFPLKDAIYVSKDKYSMPNFDQFHLHGHTHSKKKYNGKQMHVGVTAWDYKPVSISEVESFISRTKRKEYE